MDIMSNRLPNFKELNGIDGIIYGGHNKVKSINPHKCRFVATYPSGESIFGTGLFQTGWDQLPQGLSELKYELSTGHVIEIPRARAYLPLIEVSVGMDGSRIFHFINVNCLMDNEVIIYKIVLRQDNIQPYKIGDVIMSRSKLPETMVQSWKFTDFGR